MNSNSGILSENTKANYTERYDSLLKMKNHVKLQYGTVWPDMEKIISKLMWCSFTYVYSKIVM